jgi:hypothetical protein
MLESWLIAIGVLGGFLLLLWLTRSGRRPERKLTEAEREAIARTPGERMKHGGGWGGQ